MLTTGPRPGTQFVGRCPAHDGNAVRGRSHCHRSRRTSDRRTVDHFHVLPGIAADDPSLYKIAGQLIPFVLHVAARTVATHALSIFGDHSDVMAVRQTGCALLCANSVQQAQDFAVISQIATLNSRVPFIHFFDGFRTSHEMNKIIAVSRAELSKLIPAEAIRAHRDRALSPEHPVIRGTSANPDTYFQAREATNPWYDAVYQHVTDAMAAFGEVTGRYYQPFTYYGHPQAERLIILMGSAAGPAEEVTDKLIAQGEKSACWKCISTGRSPHSISSVPFRTVCSTLPCLTGPKKQVPRQSRSIWM